MRRLHNLGQTDVDLNVYCLGRLKESLIHNARYAQVALTLRANTAITWDEAVDLLPSYEMTLAPGTPAGKGAVAPQTIAEGVDDLPPHETVKKLQAEVKTLNRALLGGAGKGAGTPAFSDKCYSCGGPHKKHECPKLNGKGGGKGKDKRDQVCSHCKRTGHQEAACLPRRGRFRTSRPSPSAIELMTTSTTPRRRDLRCA
jgi:hypothetical protein